MAANIPAVLKPITPYVLRGRELMKVKGDEVVAYHCFKHAMDLGIKLNDKSPECQGFLLHLMGELETMNQHLKGRSQEELKTICENYAQAVFQRADSVDKAGNADQSTAKTFYAAASFFEILKQFDPAKELEPDIKQLVIYSKWKAADILKAIKEGRKPTPGGPQDGSTPDHHEDAPHSNPSPPPAAPTFTPKEDIPVARPAAVHAPSAPAARNQTFTRQVSSLSRTKKADCLEYIKFARAALEADDVDMTIERLQAALALLHEN
jgi:vacuolar protein sorting-associated protein VTA1